MCISEILIVMVCVLVCIVSILYNMIRMVQADGLEKYNRKSAIEHWL